MKTIYFTYLLLLINSFLNAQNGGLLIGGGTIVTMQGAPKIVIEDGKYTFDGSFIDPGDSEIIFAGSAPYEESIIGGFGFNQFKNLTINKSANGIRLGGHFYVQGDVNFLNGHIDLNGNNLYLEGDGTLVGESEDSRIIGENGGFVSKSLNLNAPNNENPGNLGVCITTNKDLGWTTISRGHVPRENEGNQGIQRYFDIHPTNNGGLNTDLKFQYFDGELNGNTESELTIYRHDGSNWEDMGLDFHDMVNNQVQVWGVDHFSLWTIAKTQSLLPLEWLRFSAQLNEWNTVDLEWQVVQEIDNEKFVIEKSKDGFNFFEIGELPSQGHLVTASYYFEDTSPFEGNNYYRIKQIDLNGTYTYSSIETVFLEISDSGFSLYPNPSSGAVEVSFSTQEAAKAVIYLTDVVGRQLKVLWEGDSISNGFQKQSFDLSELPTGMYFIHLRTINAEISQKLIIEK